MAEENLNPQEGHARDEFRETVLVRNPTSGQVEAVTHLKNEGNRYAVHTTQPLTKNKSSFFDFRSSNALAAFITGFKSQKDNPIDFQFLKFPINEVAKIVDKVLRLDLNPNDDEGLKALREHMVYPKDLAKIKFDLHEFPWDEMRELGISKEQIRPDEVMAMMQGGATKQAFSVKTLPTPNISSVGMYTLHLYHDHNGDVKLGMDSVLAIPEYAQEQYQGLFGTDDKNILDNGGTMTRLVDLFDPHTGLTERCYVGLESETNRFVKMPVKDVTPPRYFNGARIDDAKFDDLKAGGAVRLEGCHYYNDDNLFSGRLQYDVHSREYRMTEQVFSRPYIPKFINDQLSPEQRTALVKGEQIDGRSILAKNGKPYNCDLKINPKTNGLAYVSSRQEQKETTQQEQAADQTREQDAPQKGQGRKR